MIDKEIGELRRHLRRERSNITSIYGCYVNTSKEIITEFRLSTGMMLENEADKYFSTLRRVLSGGLGRNLIDIGFKTSQVAGSEEHKLLMDLRQTKLQDETIRQSFYKKVMESAVIEENFLILLACDTYDVPFKSKEDAFDKDRSDESFTYILCAVCPVKETKANLHYVPEEKVFHDGAVHHMLSAPAFGFLFPAFDNRATNIYNALYYTRSTKENQDAFLESIFNTPVPKPAQVQKESFEALLTTSLGEECSLDVVQAVHQELSSRMEMHKEAKVPEPLLVTKEEVKEVLTACGISEGPMAKFSVDFDETFGYEAQLHPRNLIDSKHFEVHTPDVVIKVAPSRSDLIETRVIDGVKYILICAEEDVEVNGVSIHFPE